MIAIGIDPSLTRTGLALYSGAWQETACFTSSHIAGLRNRVERMRVLVGEIASQIINWIEPTSGVKVCVFVEGYSFGSKGRAIYQLGEFGGVLRWVLSGPRTEIFEVPPSTMKKYATGKGNANKAAVFDAAQVCANVPIANSDEADAWWLARLGYEAMGGPEGDSSSDNTESVATLQRLMKEERATWS